MVVRTFHFHFHFAALVFIGLIIERRIIFRPLWPADVTLAAAHLRPDCFEAQPANLGPIGSQTRARGEKQLAVKLFGGGGGHEFAWCGFGSGSRSGAGSGDANPLGKLKILLGRAA